MKVAHFQVVSYNRILNLETNSYEWTHYIEERKNFSVHYNEEITKDMVIDATKNKLWFRVEHCFFFIHWGNPKKYIFAEPKQDDVNGVCDWKFWRESCERNYYFLKLLVIEEVEEE